MDRLRAGLKRHGELVLVVGVLGILMVGYLYNLTGWLIYDDEGEYLYQVWRMTEGLLPYRDFLTPQLPIFLFLGSFLMSLAGPSLLAIRLFSVLLAFFSAVMLIIAGRKHSGNLIVGLLAAVLFLLHADVFKETRIFRNEPLFLAFVTAGLVAATWSNSEDNKKYLMGGGILFGLATLVKLFGILPAAGVALWLIWDAIQKRDRIKTVIQSLLLLLIPLVVTVLVLSLVFLLIEPSYLNQTLVHHLSQGSGESLLNNLLEKVDLFGFYFGLYAIFLIVAIGSGAVGLRTKDHRSRWIWQIPTALAFFMLSRELGQRHFMFLIPAMSLLVGWALGSALSGRYRWYGRLASLIVLGLILVPWLRLNIDRSSWLDKDTVKVIEAINALSPEGSPILSDDIGLAFYSRRPTTYSGAALSHGAATSGQISGEQLISEIVEDNVKLVIVDESLLTGNHMVFLGDYPRFHRFLENNFDYTKQIRRDFQELAVWTRKAEQPWIAKDVLDISTELNDDNRFGSSIELLGYTLGNPEFNPGDIIELTLFWKAKGAADNYWSVFTHLRSPNGSIIAQHDKVPYDGLYPPDRWSAGQIIDDKYFIQIPDDLEPGEYPIFVGLYDHLTGKRLLLTSSAGSAVPNSELRLPVNIVVSTN